MQKRYAGVPASTTPDNFVIYEFEGCNISDLNTRYISDVNCQLIHADPSDNHA